MIRSIVIGIAVVFLSVLNSAACGQSDTEIRISSDNSAAEQNRPAVAVVTGGWFMVAWEDLRQGDGDIFCRRFDRLGTPLDDDQIVNDDAAAAVQADPDLSADWFGKMFLVWRDYRSAGYPFTPDVYFQKLDSMGPIGPNRNLTTELPDSSHQSPTIAASGWSKTVVAWTDLRYRNWDVFGQVLDANGAPVGSNRKINDDVAGTPQHEPDVAVSSEGWFVVVWYDGRNGNEDIYLQKCDSSGLPLGSNIRVNSDGGTAKQKFPAVAISGEGIITVVWTDWRNGIYPANSDIFGQRFNAALSRLGGNILVNLDGTASAQRDPRIAADRMGNLAVVWSDSAGGDWNVSGQLYDGAGNPIGGNYSVNMVKTGRQLLPDVAMDGRRIYTVWADNRNGNYDIYGRIITYNSPALAANPARLELSRDRGSSIPLTATMVVTNTGYGEIPFRLKSDQSWISMTPASGATPDTITVTLDCQSLDLGTHYGRLLLVDELHHDSTAFVSVSVTITGPQISSVPDSVHFRALLEIGSPSAQGVVVSNSGTGVLAWQAATSTGWLTTKPASGVADDTLTITCNPLGLTPGEYSGVIIITDTLAVNSPDSITVTLDLKENLPFLAAAPDSLYYRLPSGRPITDSLHVVNLGNAPAHWTVGADSAWIACDTGSGDDSGYVVYTIDLTTGIPGIYRANLRIIDAAAFNNPLEIPVVVDMYRPDTVVIPPAVAGLGEVAQIQVWLKTGRETHSGSLAFAYDSALLTVDSFQATTDSLLAGRVSLRDMAPGTFMIDIRSDSLGALLSPGQIFLGDLCITANDSLDDTTRLGIAAVERFYLMGSGAIVFSAALDAGIIEIGKATAVDDQTGNTLPIRLHLSQNIPNPFNQETVIPITLDHSGPVVLEVLNILGQRVRCLIEDDRAAGEYRVKWDGQGDDGAIMASGIYFYRLSSAGRSLVRRMIFLK